MSKIISFCEALQKLNKCVWIPGAKKKKRDLLHQISRYETLHGLLSLVESSLVDTDTLVMRVPSCLDLVVCLSWLSAGRGSIISFISYICVHDSPATHLPDCHHPPLPLYKPGISFIPHPNPKWKRRTSSAGSSFLLRWKLEKLLFGASLLAWPGLWFRWPGVTRNWGGPSGSFCEAVNAAGLEAQKPQEMKKWETTLLHMVHHFLLVD